MIGSALFRRILVVVSVAALMAATLAATAGTAFAKVNPCPPQQQPTGAQTVCLRGGEGGPGGGSGGQFELSRDSEYENDQLSLQQRGGGGPGGGNRSTHIDFYDLDAQAESAGGSSETGGGHCGETLDSGEVTDSFEHGKSCQPLLPN